MRSLAILILIAVGLGGALISRHIGLLTYVWFALFRPLEWVWWDLTRFRLSLVSGLFLVLPAVITGMVPNVTHPLSLLSWAALATAVLAQTTTYVQSDLNWLDQFARLIFISTLAVTILNTRERLSQFIAVMAGSFAFYSAKAGIVVLTTGGVQFSDGQAGAFVDNNGYALAINMALPFMVISGSLLRFQVPGVKYIRKGFYAAVPLSVLTIIGTNSRGGLLALGTLAVVLALLQRRPLLWLASMVLAGVLTYNFAPMPEGYLDRVNTISNYDEVGEQSALGRLHFWRIAFKMAAANPLGVGLRNYDRAYDDYDDSGGAYGTRRSVHNSHLQMLSELGYIGFGLWILIFAYAITSCLRIRFTAASLSGLNDEDRRYYMLTSTAFVASMCAFIVGGTFIASANNELTWFTFGGIAALHRQFRSEAAVQKRVRSGSRPAPAMPPPRRPAIA